MGLDNYIGKFEDYISIGFNGNNVLDKLAIWYGTILLSVGSIFGIKKRTIPKDITLDYGTYKMSCGRYLNNVFVCSNKFESWMYSYMDLKDGTFIDVGSNLGKYAIFLGSKGIKTLAIEAEATNYAKLRDNIILNKLQSIVIPIQVACSNKKGYTDLYIDNLWDGGTHSTARVRNNIFTEKVPTDTIDNLIKMFNLKDIKLIKIDVEGAESLVLEGAVETIKKWHPNIIFEAWNKDYFAKCRDILIPLGYSIVQIPTDDTKENYFAIW